MSDLAELRVTIETIVGAEHVTTSESELERHGHDESWHETARPDLVVFPGSTDEVAAIVRACHARRVPMIPFGAGSSLEGNVAALTGGVSIDLTRMNRILSVRPEDLDATIEAGVTRRQLEERLREDGVFFSVDPGADATLGGMAATGASGTTAVRYGTMRENVLSLTIVTADGEIMRTRSRARKSSAGYDLTHLLIGSEGTLGVICELTVKLHPLPEATASAIVNFPTVRDAVEAATETIQMGQPVAR
ncbi:MAG: FAD-binding oxidoreductase, partial [Gaiellales bacterium]